MLGAAKVKRFEVRTSRVLGINSGCRMQKFKLAGFTFHSIAYECLALGKASLGSQL